MLPFNPLAYRSCLDAVPLPIEKGEWTSDFIEHIPFSRLLVELLRPRVYVALALGSGASYLTVCQCVAALKLSCACFGIDPFVDDTRSGAAGSEVERRLRARHDSRYGGFSQIIASTLSAAADGMADGSIDLLCVDGGCNYSQLARDFVRWAPKLSPRGVVLLHGISARGLGVHRLWEELAARHPHFASKHGQGLGVLAIGAEIPQELRPLLDLDAQTAEQLEALFALLGNRLALKCDLARSQSELQSLLKMLQTDHPKQVGFESTIRHLNSVVEGERKWHSHVEATLRDEIKKRDEILSAVNQSWSFRIGMMATAPLRWVGKLTHR